MADSPVARRRLFMHAAHKTIGVSASLAALQAGEVLETRSEGKRPERTLRLCLVSDESLALWEEHLHQRYDVRCRRALRNADDLTGLESLDQCDCLVLLAQEMAIGGAPLERIRRYCRRGGPVIGLRAGGHTFQNWPGFESEVFGVHCQGHYGAQTVVVTIAEAARHHPVLAGVEPFVSHASLCPNAHLAADVTVLLLGATAGYTEPVAWLRQHTPGRVFCTSLGHPDDFQQSGFLRLLGNAISWVCRSAYPG